jgi:hypothetical protein
MKLTEWYSGDQTPSRAGVYQRDYSGPGLGDEAYSYWDGKTWGMGSQDAETAEWYHERFSQRGFPGLPWRGVAK